jgi:hypothetical protein
MKNFDKSAFVGTIINAIFVAVMVIGAFIHPVITAVTGFLWGSYYAWAFITLYGSKENINWFRRYLKR